MYAFVEDLVLEESKSLAHRLFDDVLLSRRPKLNSRLKYRVTFHPAGYSINDNTRHHGVFYALLTACLEAIEPASRILRFLPGGNVELIPMETINGWTLSSLNPGGFEGSMIEKGGTLTGYPHVSCKSWWVLCSQYQAHKEDMTATGP